MTTKNSLFTKHENNKNIWLSQKNKSEFDLTDYGITPTVLSTEIEVGKAMLEELFKTAQSKEGLPYLGAGVRNNYTVCWASWHKPRKQMLCWQG